MPRIRTIKPEFWTDEKIVTLSPHARLLYIGMWNFCDDEGYLWEEPLSLKLRILPTDNVDCGALINQLVEAGILIRYTADDGKVALHVRHFTEHQRISHPAPSKIFPLLQGVLASPPENSGGFHTERKGRKEGFEGSSGENRKRFANKSNPENYAICESCSCHVLARDLGAHVAECEVAS